MTEERAAEPNERNAAPERSAPREQAAPPSPAEPTRRSPMLPVLLSVLALGLAAVSLAGLMKLNQRLNARQPDNALERALEHKVAAIEHRVSHVESLLTTSRHDMVRAELKKMLLNLQELSRLADDQTRAEIAKAEAVLLRLSSPATRVRAKVDLKSARPAPAHVAKPAGAAKEAPRPTAAPKTSPAPHASSTRSSPKAAKAPASASQATNASTPARPKAKPDAKAHEQHPAAGSNAGAGKPDHSAAPKKPAATPATEKPAARAL